MRNTRDNSVALNYLWQRLREEYQLDGWRLVIDPRPKQRMGQCRHSLGEIGVSQWILYACKWSDIEDTLRHEIAHALVGPGHKHGPTWRRAARRVGADPFPRARLDAEARARRPKTARERGQHKWAGRCACKDDHRKARLLPRHRHRYECKLCGGKITWWERY